MQTATVDLLDVDPFDLVADEVPWDGRKTVTAHLPGLDDDPVGELDDDTLVILQAMHELDLEQGRVEAAGFNPELHKRWPKGHPLAGKFRPMVDLLKQAIRKHDGQGHPFQNFKREQLRDAAKKRGIALGHGESKDSIADKLLADLGGPPDKPAAPAKTAAKKAVKNAAPPKAAPPRTAGARKVLGTNFSPAMQKALADIEDSGGMQKQRADFQLEYDLTDEEMDRLIDEGFVEVDDSAGGGGYIAITPRGERALEQLATPGPADEPPAAAKKAVPAKKAVKKARPNADPGLPAGVKLVPATSGAGEVAYNVSLDGEQIGAVHGDKTSGLWLAVRPPGSSWPLKSHGFKPSREEALKQLVDSYKAARTTPTPPRPAPRPAPPVPEPPSPARPAASSKLIGNLIPDSYREADAREAEIRSVIEERLNGRYAGLTVKVQSVRAGPGRAEFEADILDVDGSWVGNTHRMFSRSSVDGKVWAYHAHLSLNRKLQGQGFAEAWNSHLMAWYSESGLDRVEVSANIDAGGYTWARQGFDWKEDGDAKEIADLLQRHITAGAAQYDADQIRAARDVIDRIGRLRLEDPDFPTAYEVSQVGRKPGQGKDHGWPGKDAMLGSSWSGVKPVPAAGGALAVS